MSTKLPGVTLYTPTEAAQILETNPQALQAKPRGEGRTKFPVMELFGPTIQGEGRLCGQVSYFIRFGGCGYRCAWCDSMHAVDPEHVKAEAEWLEPEQITDRLYEGGKVPLHQKGLWVTLSGGDPVIWDLTSLVMQLKALGFRIAVETQGEIWRPWLALCDLVTISPKPPSSRMAGRFDVRVIRNYLNLLGERTYFKVVVFTDADYEWARNLHIRYKDVPMFLSAGTPQWDVGKPIEESVGLPELRDVICAELGELAERVLRDPAMLDVSVLPQMHVLMWGTKKGV